MKHFHPTMSEAVELIKMLVADLKRVPFDVNEEERRTHVQLGEELAWRYLNYQNGGSKKDA